MDIFDLQAKISLDMQEYINGLDGAERKTKNFGSRIGSGLATVAKVGTAAIGAATTAAVAFGGASVKTGMQFDSSMSQVAATMGTTVENIQELRDYALDMGSKTSFSASQAADALNYMALAGYSAEESMQALPNVLNLAAAGGIELAAASDMVTDAQSALGLSFEESAELVDKMAKASSKSNTSVAQLGDAILTVGGTAQSLAGGTTELTQVLGLLADNGIKGAEGGTALRNVILSLSAPTDTARKKMEDLGLEVFDAEGNMRPMVDIFGDLNEALSTMTQGERTEVLSDLFNKVDLKSVNALLQTDAERWNDLATEIDNAKGSAEQMAETQLDNLTGDITLLKSALEGAQIVVSDQLTPGLRDFVQFGTDGITRITEAFKEGGLSGAMDELGNVLSEGIVKISEKLPSLINAGVSLLKSLLEGIIKNLPELTKSAIDIVKTLARGIADNAGQLLSAFLEAILDVAEELMSADTLQQLMDAGTQMIVSLADAIIEAIPRLVEILPQLIENVAQALISQLPTLVDVALQLILALAQGILDAIPSLVAIIPNIITSLVTALLGAIPQIINAGIQLLTSLVSALPQIINAIVAAIPQIINGIITAVVGAIPQIVQAGIDLLVALIQALPDIITTIVTALPEIITSIIEALLDNLDLIIQAGVDLFVSLIQNLPTIIVEIVKAVPEIIEGIVTEFGNLMYKIVEIGGDIVKGLWEGIQQLASWLWDKVSGWISGIWNDIMGFFGIASPSKKMAWIGEMMARGLAVGIEKYGDVAVDAANSMSSEIMDTMQGIGESMDSMITDGVGAKWRDAFDAPNVEDANGLFEATTNSTGNNGALTVIVGLLESILDNMGYNLVLDTGELVGTMDRELGVAALRKARGN